jgi:hypothetical protein
LTQLLFASYLAPSIRPLYEFVAAACGASRLIQGKDWRELAEGQIDLAFVCSPPLIWLGGAVEAIAAPVLAGNRFAGRPLYSSDVVVARDAPFDSFGDLRGARWAYNEPSSWSGYWVTLAQIGDWSYFGQVVATGYHQRALDNLGPAPIQPVVVRRGLDPDLKHELQQRLLELRGPVAARKVDGAAIDCQVLAVAVLERFSVERFVPAPDYSLVELVVASRAPTGSR